MEILTNELPSVIVLHNNIDGNSHVNIYLKSLSEHNTNNINEKIFTGTYLIFFPNQQYFIGKINNSSPSPGIYIFK